MTIADREDAGELPQGSGRSEIPEADLVAGAHELVHACLAVAAEDRVLVLTDIATEQLADYIVRAASVVATTTKRLVGDLDADFAASFALIEQALDELRPTVTVFAANDAGDLLAWEPRFGQHLDALGARHAQMPALDATSLGVGMATSYVEVATFSETVRRKLAGTREIAISNSLGTDILFTLDPDRPWIPLGGLYRSSGQRGRLPQGEVFCAPLTADGDNCGLGARLPLQCFNRFAGRAGALRNCKWPAG